MPITCHYAFQSTISLHRKHLAIQGLNVLERQIHLWMIKSHKSEPIRQTLLLQCFIIIDTQIKISKNADLQCTESLHLTLSRLELPPVPALHHSSSDAWAELNTKITASFLGILKKKRAFSSDNFGKGRSCYQCWRSVVRWCFILPACNGQFKVNFPFLIASA